MTKKYLLLSYKKGMADKMLNFGGNCPKFHKGNEGTDEHTRTKYGIILTYLSWMRENMRSGPVFDGIDLP